MDVGSGASAYGDAMSMAHVEVLDMALGRQFGGARTLRYAP